MKEGLKFWKIAVVLLVLCNIGLMLTLWLKPQVDGGGPPRRESPRDIIVRQLKFTDEQVKQYDVLIREHQDSMQRLRDGAKNYRQQLFENLKNTSGNSGFADSLSNLIGNNQARIESVTYDHFSKVRSLCTDNQKAEFDRIIVDVTSKMSGPGGPHPQDGPPPGREGPPPPPRGDCPPQGGDGNNPPPPRDR
jgi:protein CpxP